MWICEIWKQYTPVSNWFYCFSDLRRSCPLFNLQNCNFLYFNSVSMLRYPGSDDFRWICRIVPLSPLASPPWSSDSLPSRSLWCPWNLRSAWSALHFAAWSLDQWSRSELVDCPGLQTSHQEVVHCNPPIQSKSKMRMQLCVSDFTSRTIAKFQLHYASLWLLQLIPIGFHRTCTNSMAALACPWNKKYFVQIKETDREQFLLRVLAWTEPNHELLPWRLWIPVSVLLRTLPCLLSFPGSCSLAW